MDGQKELNGFGEVVGQGKLDGFGEVHRQGELDEIKPGGGTG